MDIESKYMSDNNNGYLNNTTRTLVSQDCVDHFLKASSEKTNKLKIYAKISDRKGVSTNYLEELYLKYSVNLEKYFSNNRDGMKLSGNKHFDKYPYQMFINDQGNQSDNNKNHTEMNEQNKSQEMCNFEDKYFLTPLPDKSRKLFSTKKEKKDFQFAERVAVVMRTYEYTHGLRSKLGMQEYQQMMNEDKKRAFNRMKSIVNKIQLWYKRQKRIREKRLKDKIKREEIESKEFQEKYSKYLQALYNKKKRSGFTKLENYTHRLLLSFKKQFIEELREKAAKEAIDKFKLLKIRNNNMYNWYTHMSIVSSKNLTQSFSLIGQPKLKIWKKVKSKNELKKKKIYYQTCKWNKLLFLQYRIKSFAHYTIFKHKRALPLCFKPQIAICYMSLGHFDQNSAKVKLNKMKIQIAKKTKYDQISLFMYLSQWKRKIQELKRKEINDRKQRASLLLFTRYLRNYLSKIRNKTLRYSYNKIKSKQRCYNVLHHFKMVISSIVNDTIVSSLQYKISSKRLTQAITKTLLRKEFWHWHRKVTSVHHMFQSLYHFSISLTKDVFFNNLTQINKDFITNYSETKSNANNYDNNFRYYCIINRSKQRNDFYSFRIVLGYKLFSHVYKNIIDIHFIFKRIKKHKAQKKLKGESLQQDVIRLNPRLSSKLSQFRTKLEKIDYIILRHFESEFFHRIVLNHLVNSALQLDNEELISLLKLGKESTYQTVLNRVLELNLTENEGSNNEMTLLTYVQKFINEKK